MQYIISIEEAEELWTRYNWEHGRTPPLQWRDVVRFAFQLAHLQATPNPKGASFIAKMESEVRKGIIDGLPLTGQSGFCPPEKLVWEVIDLIGQISRIVTKSVARIIGKFDYRVELECIRGPDLVISVPTFLYG